MHVSDSVAVIHIYDCAQTNYLSSPTVSITGKEDISYPVCAPARKEIALY